VKVKRDNMDLTQLVPDWIRSLTAYPPGMPNSEPQASDEIEGCLWT